MGFEPLNDQDKKAFIFSLLDLTSLGDADNEDRIHTLCRQASTGSTHVAALCVYPRFIKTVLTYLPHPDIKIATVANFPYGNASISEVLKVIEGALFKGAAEIDVVFPFAAYLAGERKYAREFVKTCRASGNFTLKIILETGVFHDKNVLLQAACDALEMGADFLKTSTGKIAKGATLTSSAILLAAIKKEHPQKGFKASGGIKTFAEAQSYVQLAAKMMGEDWVTKNHFRLGVSSLSCLSDNS